MRRMQEWIRIMVIDEKVFKEREEEEEWEKSRKRYKARNVEREVVINVKVLSIRGSSSVGTAEMQHPLQILYYTQHYEYIYEYKKLYISI